MNNPDLHSTPALRRAAAFFAVAAVAHNADHFRRGTDSVSAELLLVGTVGLVASTLVVVLVALRHRLAPHVAVVGGIALALGFTAVHWLPTWSVLSDSFLEAGAAPVSQVASLAEVVGAVAVAAAGAYTLRRSSSRTSVAGATQR